MMMTVHFGDTCVRLTICSRYAVFRYSHDMDLINVPAYNVYSKIEGPNVGIEHHGAGAVSANTMPSFINDYRDLPNTKFNSRTTICTLRFTPATVD